MRWEIKFQRGIGAVCRGHLAEDPMRAADTVNFDTWQKAYEHRIRSSDWKKLKAEVIKARGYKCERCGSGYRLDLHHKTYERLGCERPDDVELVCKWCHPAADHERRLAAERRRKDGETARYEAALDTYATKKYGENWEMARDPDDVAEEFDRWREHKQQTE